MSDMTGVGRGTAVGECHSKLALLVMDSNTAELEVVGALGSVRPATPDRHRLRALKSEDSLTSGLLCGHRLAGDTVQDTEGL